ncbi:MAG: (Fe-S)-binding protein [Candidatus Lokiarchaeota archaeon]|nr:(Fe-S)-binding protein [Candidatus Lokiarchaeota archaeon]
MKKLVLKSEKSKYQAVDNEEVQKIINMCYQCGKCSEACPVSELIPRFSPRYIASEYITEEKRNYKIWYCLTCDRCTSICPQGVKFADFIQNCRIQAIENREKTGLEEAHFSYYQSLSRLMAHEKIVPKRLKLLPEGIKISKPGESDIMYFVGCAPLSYYEQHQFNIGVDYSQITEATIKILNKIDIEPVILDKEKCCGHDSIWSGDLNTFIKLGEQNIKNIEEAGIKTVIFSCAEGLRTFKKDYPRYIRKPKFEVISFAEFIAEKIKKNEFSFPYNFERKVTYHDPCRMGRQLGIFDAPREILQVIDGTELIEMERIREEAQCCGITGWNNCNTHTKFLRNARLQEAERTNADTLITTCPKCQMHFNCLKRETILHGFHKFDIEITDLSVFMAKALYLI